MSHSLNIRLAVVKLLNAYEQTHEATSSGCSAGKRTRPNKMHINKKPNKISSMFASIHMRTYHLYDGVQIDIQAPNYMTSQSRLETSLTLLR